MFDVGFWELTLIMLVVLVVVGPERLPKLARTVGLWTNRARRMVADVKAEVEREIKAQELKESMGANVLKEVRDVADEMRAIGTELKADVDAAATKVSTNPPGPEQAEPTGPPSSDVQLPAPGAAKPPRASDG
jgi:sec-independent protein translocase protein TatB